MRLIVRKQTSVGSGCWTLRATPHSSVARSLEVRRLIPKSGMIVPEMGRARRVPHSSVADALFTPVQQRVLGLLFGQPDRRYQSAEIIRLARGGVGAAHRQLSRLAASGLVTVTQVGNQKHYQARADSAIFRELHGLVVKMVGVAEPLRKALGRLAKDIRAAFVYGSLAKGSDKATSDIDLLVISSTVTYAEAYEALQEAEAILGRSINPTVLTLAQWRSRRSRGDTFAARVAAQPRLFVIGSEDDLG
jgi:predicted nucleotidyltransferase